MRCIALLITGISIALELVACVQPTASVPTPAIAVVTALPPAASPTSVVCTENPSGLILDVQSGGFYRVRVAGRGFKPGEQLLLVFTTETAAHNRRIEARPAQGVDSDGNFAWDGTLGPPVDNGYSVRIWNVAVVHSRGVACKTVEVP